MSRLTLKNIKCFCTEFGECWLWDGATTKGGHPVISDGRNKVQTVKRVVSSLVGGEITKGLVVVSAIGLEKCDVRCVRPAHLQRWTRSKMARVAHANAKPRSYAAQLAALARGGQLKLDAQKARAIRASTDKSHVEAAKWGVSKSLIQQVRRFEIWPESAPNSSVFTQRA